MILQLAALTRLSPQTDDKKDVFFPCLEWGPRKLLFDLFGFSLARLVSVGLSTSPRGALALRPGEDGGEQGGEFDRIPG